MKILSLQFPEPFEGITPVRMTGLGEVVVLAGANGSGKSRLLRALKHYADNHLPAQTVEDYKRQIRQLESAIQHNESVLDRLGQNAGSTQSKLDEISSTQKAIDQHRAQATKLMAALAKHDAIETEPGGEFSAVMYSVKSTSLTDPGTFRLSELDGAMSSMASELNLAMASNYGLAALQSLVDSYNYAVGEERAKLEKRIARLQVLLEELLQTKLTWDGKDRLKLFGRPISNESLSDGQKVLLQVALSIFFQAVADDRLILLLDEPENHLHPIAILSIVDRIRSAFPNAQIWLATHSLHLLAHYDPDAIWYVSSGNVQHAGRRSLSALHMALAGDAGANELRAFLELPAQYAALAFAAECVLPPAVVDTAVGDPQTSQIATLIYDRVGQTPIRLLDFGMGKGRLISELHDMCRSRNIDLPAHLDYLGLNHHASPEDRGICVSRIEETFGNADGRYFDGVESLRQVDDSSVDLIVMCNVLHEVSPADWLGLFGPNGALSRVLKTGGSLLIVEDQILRVGENAHEFGFLVLDSIELKCLFGIRREDHRIMTAQHAEERYANRLKAHSISGELLGNVSATTRRAAIEQVREGALLQVKSLAARGFRSHRDAQSYAFWAHQFVNASIACEVF